MIKISKIHIESYNFLKNLALRFLVLIFAFCILNFNCYAEAISSTELIQNAREYDGQKITYEGEAVGEVMRRKDGAWVNVYDGENAIGVWLPLSLVSSIEYAGSHKAQGDIIEVKGKFNNACLVHGGDLDIHAVSITKIKPGWEKQEYIIPAKRDIVIILSIILCLLLISKILIFK